MQPARCLASVVLGLVATMGVQFCAWSADELLGAPACAQCHEDHSKRQANSRHALALRPIAATRLPQLLMDRPLRERNGVSFAYHVAEKGLGVTVRKNGDRASALLEWAFGAGAQGITPVGRVDGQYFEHRISYYVEPARADRTLGHPGESSRNAHAALGQMQTPETMYACFNCHSTGVRGGKEGPDLSAMRPGIECERCHGPGTLHVMAVRSSQAVHEIRKTIGNPGRLPAGGVVEMCGECHRSSKPGASPTPEIDDPVSVRFQPVGLKASRCFLGSKNLSCLTCHDPHEDARHRDALFYAAKCLACHSNPPDVKARCKRAEKQNCLPCHMRRGSPLPFLSFTDHRIRVY
jgi:Cytochrome c554 and c-prime